MSTNQNVKSILYALVANFAVACAKLFAAIFTGSGSMMAESIHSFADCSNQGLLLLGVKNSKRPPSSDFPLGHGKEIYFWSFIVAIVLFCLGGVFSIYEGIHKLHATGPLKSPMIAIGILIFSIIVEGMAFRSCLKSIEKVRAGRSYWQWFKDSRQSELVVVFGEDFAALIGLFVALMAIVLSHVTGNVIYDAIGSIIIGCLLVVIAVFIGIEVKNLLIGQGVEKTLKDEFKQFIEADENIEAVLNMVTLQMGSDVMVALKAKMVDGQSAKEMIHSINACEQKFKEKFPQVMWLFFEPDIAD
ncbi:cation efflux family transporter [Halobacteriovorax marinus]|uniref:Cation efflux family transporter n=1 Tax=Halobacteriovorax marinus TaxID=97084 RepID=A0A1Y5F7N8_9BACT|nr:cation efflux family transporter [Halobacteriovorax marinus]